MSVGAKTGSLSEVEIARLRDLRLGLLRLHKSLLNMEQQDFEKMFGRLSSGELLQLVINHAQFAWLRMVSALVVEIDELLNGDEPAAVSDFQELLSQAQSLLTSSRDEAFNTRYQAALQRDPAVVMAHADVMQLLRRDD